MVKVFRRIVVAALALIMALGTFVFAACGVELKELQLENQQTLFKPGDEFITGEDFKVWALYSDGTKTDVTAEARVDKESSLDMSVAGTYQITVRFGGLVTSYDITVSPFDRILRRIELDTAAVRKTFYLGENYDYDGLKLTATFENAQGDLVPEEFTSLKEFDVEVRLGDKVYYAKTANGTETANEALAEMGEYTVTVSSGSVNANYKFTVEDVDVSSVRGAINAGKAFRGEVLSGTQSVTSSLHEGGEYRESAYRYEFGKNYTYVTERVATPVEELHMSIEDGALLCVSLLDGNIAANSYSNIDMVNGPATHLWYVSLTIYGVEDALQNLYTNALTATNNDLKEGADSAKKEYSFSYSGIFNEDYYETSVTFKLGEKNNIESADINQGYWENNEDAAGADWYVPSFITDETTGKTRPNIACSKRVKIAYRQVAGERTKTNPYSNETLLVSSFNVNYGGKTLENGETVSTDMAHRTLTLTISDVLPATADFANDAMYFNLVGSHESDVNSTTIFVVDGFNAYRNGDRITVFFEHGGEWELILKTTAVTKTVKFKVTGVAPEQMTPSLYNSASKTFYSATEKTIIVGGEIGFMGTVNDYADSAQTATLLSGDAAKVTIKDAEYEGTEYFTFAATEAGTYKVKVASDSAPAVSCEFTFNVIEAPDMAAILDGAYTVTDSEANIYDVVFAPDSKTGTLTGTVTVTRTPTEIRNPLPGEEGSTELEPPKTQVLSYTVEAGSLDIALTSVSGENLGVAFLINEIGELELEDQYGLKYTLERKAD